MKRRKTLRAIPTFRLASRRDWDKMARDLRPVYTAVNEADAAAATGQVMSTNSYTTRRDSPPRFGSAAQAAHSVKEADTFDRPQTTRAPRMIADLTGLICVAIPTTSARQ